MRTVALFLAFVPLLPAQVTANLTIVRRDGVRRLFDRRVAKVASVWVVALENQGNDTVGVSESAILRKVPHLQPIDAPTMLLWIEDGARNSGWSIAGRLAQDGVQISTLLSASGQIKVSQPILAGLTAATAFGPYLIARFQGKAPPLAQNFRRLAWSDIVKLGPGQSATTHIFTATWPDDSKAVSVTIDTSRLPPVKLAQ